MSWVEQFYRIAFDNGETKKVFGLSNGLFGVTTPEGSLSHIKTGYSVARFVNAEAAVRVADYLTETYAEEFTLLHKQYRKSLTYDQYLKLPAQIDLNNKIKADAYFQSQILQWAVKQNKEL